MAVPTPVPTALPEGQGPPTLYERAVDLSSRILYLIPFLFFFSRAIHRLDNGWDTHTFLLLVSGALGCLFAVTARFTRNINRQPAVALLTLAASEYYLFIGLSEGASIIPGPITTAAMLTGLGFSIVGKLWLGRSFGVLPANRGLVMTGPYSLIRHPIYFGYILAEVGYLGDAFSLRNTVVTLVGIVLQAFRILEEEKVLKKAPEYALYATRVRYRFIPFVF